MRWLAVPLLALAACGEPSSTRTSPVDRFVYPVSLALTPREGGGSALVVASGNFDLAYDGATGGTLISVDPRPAAQGGSARPGGGAVTPLGGGAHVASFVGELVVADATSCPVKAGDQVRPAEALVATRYADEVWRLPLGADGSLGPCAAGGCVVGIDRQLHDPFGMTLACRPDGLRRTAFVSYLRRTRLDERGLTGWLVEVDLDDPTAPGRLVSLGSEGMAGMAYDARTDRLFVLERGFMAAPVHVLDLSLCPQGLATCPEPAVSSVNLFSSLDGLDLQSIALSNPQPGLARRAYVSARVYDPNLASLLGFRPGSDLGAALLVLDLEEGPTGRPALKVLRIVRGVPLGTSQVRVLPVRPALNGQPQRDLVVVSGTTEGTLAVYDDQQGQVVRVLPIDPVTGAPEAGRGPYGLASELLPGVTPATARVYVAASQQALVSMVDVPLDNPARADLSREAGTDVPMRIGGLQ